jgi:hypothetical protein
MKLKLVPPRQGMLWVRHGLRVFFQRPVAFCLLLFLYMLIGPMLAFAIAPLVSLGFMIATRQALQGRFPMPGVFIEPLRSGRAQRWAQLQLGVAYAVGIALVLWLGDSIGGSALAALHQTLSSGHATPDEIAPLVQDPSFLLAWAVVLLGLGLLSVPFWHAPALVHWDAQPVAKALFFSTVACWRNKAALSVYMLGWTAVTLVFAVLSNLLLGLLGAGQLLFVAAMPAALMLSAAFYASLYFTFADSFEPAAAPLVLEDTP